MEWLLVGSAARALQGFAVRPADLDLEVSAADAAPAASALGLAPRRAAADGRASTRAEGVVACARIDLTCDLEVRGPGGMLGPDFSLQRAWATPVEVAGRPVLLAPIEETLARALVEGDWRLARLGREARPGIPSPRPGYLAARLSSATASATR